MKAHQVQTDIGRITYEPRACLTSKDTFWFSTDPADWQRGPRLRHIEREKAKRKQCQA